MVGLVGPELYEQRLVYTITIPPAACCLKYYGVLVLTTLNVACVVQVSSENTTIWTSTIYATLRLFFLYIGFLLPTILPVGCLVQDSNEQRLPGKVYYVVLSMLYAVRCLLDAGDV